MERNGPKSNGRVSLKKEEGLLVLNIRRKNKIPQKSHLKVKRRGDGDDYVKDVAIFFEKGYCLFAYVHEWCVGVGLGS